MDTTQDRNKIQELEKVNRILEKKLKRAQINLAMLEETNDRKEALLNQVIHDLRTSEATLALRSQENANLYEQSQINAQQLQIALNELKAQEEQVRQQNEQLAIANVELARAARLKDEFLATVGHELRTPLNGILGYSELLLEEILGSLNEKQQQSIAKIDTCGRHLLNLINDILDLSRIQSGKLEIEVLPVSVDRLCQDSINAITPMATKKNIRLEGKIEPNLGIIQADERRMQQVLINLLSNSVKFTPEGGQVWLEIESDPQNQQLRFQVRDTGMGIPAQELERIFDRFFQVDGKLNRRQGGLGLGLAIVKRIVDLHQGTVSVSSTVGKGSCFTVSLPYTPTAHNAPSTIKQEPYILIAEDDPANMDVMTAYLGNFGFRLVCAQNGEEALQYAERETPALILMDIQMPVMDGLEAIHLIREKPHLQSVPIVAITALAMVGDADRCLQAGATEYISKPTSLKQLLSKVQQYLHGSHIT